MKIKVRFFLSLFLLFGFIFLFSCCGDGCEAPTLKCVDSDGDGYYAQSGCGAEVDCNDSDSSIYPGAPELCDGIDNQCPGDAGYSLVDENCPALEVSAGMEHTCALLEGGRVKCWGWNDMGQLGNGTRIEDSIVPVEVFGLSSEVKTISAGDYHTCAVLNTGEVICWGWNSDGQLGDGSNSYYSNVPVLVSGLSDVVAVSSGGAHTCALLNSGEVKCWGDNWAGQLGNETTEDSNVPVSVSGLSDAVAISAGGAHTCALLNSGEVKCWGDNWAGQLGNETTDASNVPVLVSGLSDAVAISAGGAHTCALLDNGGVKCWGDNQSGQLGDDSTTNSNVPIPVSGLSSKGIAISAGGCHTCALLDSGEVKCWGCNRSGQLGEGSFQPRLVPVLVSDLSGVIGITTGGTHSCAVLEEGGIKCWGDDYVGQIGSGIIVDKNVPISVSVLSGASAISLGGRHTCALLDSGEVSCWGFNSYGQVGDGTTVDRRPVPVPVSGLWGDTVVAISGGFRHSCALLASGEVKCWGQNQSGQLGDGTFNDSPVPVLISALSGETVIEISAGGDASGSHTCALLFTGEVKCWGKNFYGQLGDGTNQDRTSPVLVSGLSGEVVVSVSAGGEHTCALLDSGVVKCWGYNLWGQLGNGNNNDSNVPVEVLELSGVIAISAGARHSCALLNSGKVKCWGLNSSGQLGDGTTANSNLPVEVFGLDRVKAISAGSEHTCALLSSGKIKCWGYNFYGQLGNQGFENSSVPVLVSGISSGGAISLGQDHSCALLDGGEVKCWGSNRFSQLGNGVLAKYNIPVDVFGIGP